MGSLLQLLQPCSACDAAYAQVQLPCRTFILIIHTGTHICTYITYIHKVWSTCQKHIPRRSSGFRGSIFIQQRKQQSNCKDSINCRTKYTIQMLTAHFGLIKLSFDYAIVFCSIAIGIGDALGSGLSWDCDLAMPCHAMPSAIGNRRVLALPPLRFDVMAHPAEV